MDILQILNMEDCEPCVAPFWSRVELNKDYKYLMVKTTLYRQLVGSIIYLTQSQLDILFYVSMHSLFMKDP